MGSGMDRAGALWLVRDWDRCRVSQRRDFWGCGDGGLDWRQVRSAAGTRRSFIYRNDGKRESIAAKPGGWVACHRSDLARDAGFETELVRGVLKEKVIAPFEGVQRH